MKKILLLSAAIVLLTSCEEVESPSVLKIESEIAQTDVPIILTRAEVDTRIALENAESLVSATLNGSPIPLQFDDWDQDGQWDEVFGLMDLQQGMNKLSLSLAANSKLEETPFRTNLHLGKVVIQDSLYQEVETGYRVAGKETARTISRYQYEGPGWENELIAFRSYFDERNGIDIFGKTTSEMVLSQVGVSDNYHHLAEWGMDILKVGNSLGAGAIALSYKDSLYRVTDDTLSSVAYLTEGPLRSALEFTFPSVEVGDTVVTVQHRITIIAGMNGYQSHVSVSPTMPGLELASGIVNLETEEFFPVQSSGYAGIYTHGDQAFDGEHLGLALLADSAIVTGEFTSPESGDGITQTFGMTMALDEAGTAEYIFLAGWEQQLSGYGEREAFEEMLHREMLKLRP